MNRLTTDGHKAYLDDVEDALGAEIDYAQLRKIYGPTRKETNEVRCSLSQCMGAKRAVISGMPDYQHISTSFTERQNLTMKMSMCRFTRLTNDFSKKVEQHENALAIYFMYYISRVHQALRITPAMTSGL